MLIRGCQSLLILSLALLAASLAGCGNKGPERFHLSGKATAGGKPIPAGTITFEPQGPGPQGYARIKDGQFDTRQGGQGHSGGPMAVRVAAYDGVVANELPLGKPLFAEVMLKLDLPKQDGVQDIDTTQGTQVSSVSGSGEVVP